MEKYVSEIIYIPLDIWRKLFYDSSNCIKRRLLYVNCKCKEENCKLNIAMAAWSIQLGVCPLAGRVTAGIFALHLLYIVGSFLEIRTDKLRLSAADGKKAYLYRYAFFCHFEKP